MTTSKINIISLTLAASLASASAPAFAEEPSYNHAPVTFWLAPQIGSGGLSSKNLETNFSLSLVASAYAKLEGVDIGAGASWVTQQMRGAQVTGGFNYAPDAAGLQVAGGFNYAGAAEGAQIALVNFGGTIRGAQLGLVNIAGVVDGTQIGLVNLAKESDTPLGFFNLIENGQRHLGMWSTETTPVNLGVKLGGRTIYSLLAVGIEASGGKKRWLAGFGLGGHIDLDDSLYLNIELLASHINEDEAWTRDANVLTSLRTVFGYELHPNFSLFIGPTLNLLVAEGERGKSLGLIKGFRLSPENADTTVRMWPGLIAGFQI